MLNSCIEKWLKGSGSKCPQCNKSARRKDIRVLYAKSIRVMLNNTMLLCFCSILHSSVDKLEPFMSCMQHNELIFSGYIKAVSSPQFSVRTYVNRGCID